MPADLLGSDLFGFAERGNCLADLAALGVSASNVDKHPGTTLSRQPRGVHRGCGAQGAACIAQLDGKRYLVQAHIGGTELGVVVVAPLAQPPGDRPGPLQVLIGSIRVIRAGGYDGPLQSRPPHSDIACGSPASALGHRASAAVRAVSSAWS